MTRTPEQEATRSQIIAALNGWLNIGAERLGYLRDRWQDEREYENFNDYATEMKKLLPEGFEFVKATKAPFGFRVAHPKLLQVQIQIFAKAGSVSWKQVAK